MAPHPQDNTPPMTVNDWLIERNKLTQLLYDNPYDLILYLERATSYAQLGYHDLAAGDAYRALLLTDEVEDEAEEYHAEAEEQLRAHQAHYEEKGCEEYFKRCPCLGEAPPGNDWDISEAVAVAAAAAAVREAESSPWQGLLEQKRLDCYMTLVSSLHMAGCLKSALEYCLRGLATYPDSLGLARLRGQIFDSAREQVPADTELDIKDLPDQGSARREVYPWNEHEPDRFSSATLDFLNQELSKVGPKCEVRVTELPVLSTRSNDKNTPASSSSTNSSTNKQLGLFAKAHIRPGEIILREKSVLTASNRLHDPICDACTAVLPPTNTSSSSSSTAGPIACPDCTDTLFCSPACLSLAQSTYHPASCATDSLDASIARDVPASESADALYILLLARTLSMAITRTTHPLAMKEIKYTWGDFSAPSQQQAQQQQQQQAQTLLVPFSLSTTITTPLHLLRALNVNPYTSLATLSEPWVIQTIYAKLRSTASARSSAPASAASRSRSRSGTGSNAPNTAALHPLWCLANHDCEPNVSWGWDERDGEMRFWARGEGEGKGRGIKRGEEIRSHYCDVRLPWRERREWMVGCLRGWCRCGRCVREEREEREGRGMREGGKDD
ncbi:MAG: hypothetical protein M1816_006999 [Peltula sp. TS41687]|nr:MAG: hypothetical protein M1816_006999 [Peltula sp. TS41687]